MEIECGSKSDGSNESLQLGMLARLGYTKTTQLYQITHGD